MAVEPEPRRAEAVAVVEPEAAEPSESVTVPADEEPTWVLKARDGYAVAALQTMASQLELVGGDRTVVLEARAKAQEMSAWARRQKALRGPDRPQEPRHHAQTGGVAKG